MINIKRSTPPPESLAKEKAKKAGTYNCADVLERLQKDFLNKCNKDLKFDWNNLFFACGYCNNLKGKNYDNILNCTNPEHDVENWIKYEIEPFPQSTPVITSCRDDQMVENTVQLLSAVYNGTTPNKLMGAENLRSLLRDDILKFQHYLKKYIRNDNDEKTRAYALKQIKQNLKRSSSFAAFKRWIIKDDTRFNRDFSQYMD